MYYCSLNYLINVWSDNFFLEMIKLYTVYYAKKIYYLNFPTVYIITEIIFTYQNIINIHIFIMKLWVLSIINELVLSNFKLKK